MRETAVLEYVEGRQRSDGRHRRAGEGAEELVSRCAIASTHSRDGSSPPRPDARCPSACPESPDPGSSPPSTNAHIAGPVRPKPDCTSSASTRAPRSAAAAPSAAMNVRVGVEDPCAGEHRIGQQQRGLMPAIGQPLTRAVDPLRGIVGTWRDDRRPRTGPRTSQRGRGDSPAAIRWS